MQSKAVVDHIVQWLKDYATESGQQGFVVGVSGGVDSALTSTLCAMTGLPVWLIEMPIHQDASQVSRAQHHMRFLEEKFDAVESMRVNLTYLFDRLKLELPRVQEKDLQQMAEANTRSRMRMTTLYYFAGITRSLVVGTGNKIEDFGVGFFTKYGDGGVDVSPIADLTKSEVFALAKHVGVNEDILQAPPTDGLFGDERTDEQQMGASYPELEWAMAFCQEKVSKVNGKYNASTVNLDDLTSRESEVLNIFIRLHNANQHKMVPIPVCVIPSGLRVN
jgi:NAD+ synthase